VLCRLHTIPVWVPDEQGRRQTELRRFPDKPHGGNLGAAGIEPAQCPLLMRC